MPDTMPATERLNSVSQAFDTQTQKSDLARFLETLPEAEPDAVTPQPAGDPQNPDNVAASADPDALAPVPDPADPVTPPEIEPELDADPEAEPPDGAEPGDDPDDATHGLPEAAQRSVNKRIGKEVARRKTVETELATVKAKLAELEAKPAGDAAPVRSAAAKAPWENSPEIATLRQTEQESERAAELARDLLDRLQDEPDSVAEYLQKAKFELPDYEPRTMRRMLNDIERGANIRSAETRSQRVSLTRDAEKAYHHESARAEAASLELAPWWKDKADPNNVYVHQILDFVPEIRRTPYWQLALTDMVAGREIRLAKAKAGKAGAPAAPVAPRRAIPSPGIGGRHARTTDDQSTVAAREQAFNKTPSRATLAATL